MVILNEKNVINTVLKKANFFGTVAKALPNRSLFSCYRFIKRCFNHRNRQGKWSRDEIERLGELVGEYGQDWSLIGKKMGRAR